MRGACARGHEYDEHDTTESSRPCTVVGCACIAYEEGADADEA